MGKPWWEVRGHDSFSGEEYHIFWCSRREEAFRVARQKLQEIKTTQPDSDAGGPDEPHGIQDNVFVISPDGEKFPVLAERPN